MNIEKKNIEQFNSAITNFLIKNNITLDQFWVLHLKYWEDDVNLIKLCTNVDDVTKLSNKIVTKKDRSGNVIAKSIEHQSERFTIDEMQDLAEKGLIEGFDYDRELRTSFVMLTEFCKFLLDKLYKELFPVSKEQALLENDVLSMGEELFEAYPNTAYASDGRLIAQLKSFKYMNRHSCFQLYYDKTKGNRQLHEEIINKVKSNCTIENNISVGNYRLCIGFTKFVESSLWNDLPIEESDEIRFQ